MYDGLNADIKIVMGDFNAHVGRERTNIGSVVGAWGLERKIRRENV